jgi:hypothetical protein
MWRNGYAPVCKTVYSGSIPDVASKSSDIIDPVLVFPRAPFCGFCQSGCTQSDNPFDETFIQPHAHPGLLTPPGCA